jgi:outer membrane protein TolC
MGMNYKFSGYANYMDATTYFPTMPGFDPLQRITNQTAAGWNLTLSQPLLKDFWIDKDRLTIKVNKKNLKIAELALRQEIMNIVTRIKSTYYDLIYAKEQIAVHEKALELAQLLVKETTRKAELGEASQLDAMKAQAQAETIQTDLQKARQLSRDTANALKALMNDDFKSWPGVDINPTDKMGAVAFVFNREDSWAKAMSKRPDLLQFRAELEKKDCVVQFGFNQLFPSLNAFGSYGSRAIGPSFDYAAGLIGDDRYPAFSYGLVMSVPLTRTSERNNYKASKLARQKAELQIKKLEQAILVQVENAGIQIETTQERLKSARKAREYAELALGAEQKKLAAGESTSYIVLQMQRDLTHARSEEIQTIAEYNKTMAMLAFSEGSVIEANNIELDVK